MDRKSVIKELLDVPFSFIIIKYDYHIEGKLDSIIYESKEISEGSYTIALVKDNQLVINVPESFDLLIIDIKTRNVLCTLKGHTHYISRIKILDDNRIVSVSYNGVIKIWNQGVCRHTFIRKGFIDRMIIKDNRIISTNDIGEINVCNPDTGVCELSILNNKPVSAILIMNDIIITSSRNFENNIHPIKIWKSGQLIHTLLGHTANIFEMQILSPNRIVSASADRTLRIWNLATYTCEHVLEGHTDSVTSLLVLPDHTIISGSIDTTIRIWKHRRNVTVLEGHDLEVYKLKLLPDGRLISSDLCSSFRIWNLETYTCEVIIHAHRSIVESFIILKEGGIISIGSEYDKFIKLWK